MIAQDSGIAYQIAGIKNLKMVNCYRIFGEDDTLCGIMAYYEDKTINLCNTEAHYNELFDRLVKQYAKEAPSSMIVTDEVTRQILKNAGEFDTSALETRLAAYKENSSSLFLPKAFSHYYILPMVKFLIERLYGEREGAISFDALYRDWFGQGVLGAVSNNKKLHFPYKILQKTDDDYEVRICNVLMPGDNMSVSVIFEQDKILASFTEDAYCYRGDMSIDMKGDGVTLYYCISEGKKPVATKELQCVSIGNSKVPERASVLAAGSSAEWKAYELPWKDVVYTLCSGGNEYRILSAERDSIKISRCNSFINITGEEAPKVLFGKMAFMIYEREDAAELHMLDVAYPRQAEYSARYAGKIYTAGA